MRPKILPRLIASIAPMGLLVGTAASGQTVGDLVGQVSQANIQAHIAALEGPRSTQVQMASAADYIAAHLEGFGYTVLSDPIGGTENLIAELPGTTDPDAIFLIGAHFDTVAGSPGADDNASGVAGMLEAARVLRGAQYEGSLHFVASALEEVGLQAASSWPRPTRARGRT